jgi:beta-lactamase superfamily II metal-dependent hydrolase
MRRRPLAALLAALAVMTGSGNAARAEDPKGLQIYFIDVMGGAATLIVTPAGESVLVDSGWPGADDRDPKRIVHVLKDVAGCERLDHLVTTHWHTDHYGGVAGLSKLVPIGRFWDRGLPEDGLAGLDFPDGPAENDPLGVAYRKASAGKRTALKPGDALPLKGVTLNVLASGGKVLPHRDGAGVGRTAACDEVPDKAVDGSDNARSLTFKLSDGAFDFFDAGDLTWNVEKRLVCPHDLVGAIDLYQVTHHGMDISNHPTLVKTIVPTVAVMNNGPRKGGSPATVKLMKALPGLQAFYALHRNQATGPEDNADPALTANADPAGGQFIGVQVAPDGTSYTVRIGAEGPARTFASK